MPETERSKVIQIPVSDEEKSLAEQEADKLGMPVSSFFRLLLRNWSEGITFQKKNGHD